MKIIDTYSEIFNCFGEENFNISLWEKYADSIFPNLSNKLEEDSKDYDFEKKILPVIQNLFKSKEKALMSQSAFIKVTDNLSNIAIEMLGEDIDITIVLYLGLCNGAGWATEINGQKVILLGIEKIVELDWCSETALKGLIYHELGHIFHYEHRFFKDELNNCKERSLFQLYTEGFAMYIEQLLCGDREFYHQNTNRWLDWCKNNQKRMYQLFLTKLNNNESTQGFFGDWNSIEGKSDVGYYLGCELVKHLSLQYSLKELANLNLTTIQNALLEKKND
ncbi:MAG: hypothetical protein J6C61_07105 [Clostridia bacterium]|nr:hypothetical protein [Clostridia bacterium]